MGVWEWSSPIGLGLFILMIAGTLLLLATAIRALSTMPVASTSTRSNGSTASGSSRSTSTRRASTRRRA